MSYGRITTETMTDIADAIRAKTGSEAQVTPTQMPERIRSIQTGSPDAVLYVEQELTEEEKAQARENIGAANEDDALPTVTSVDNGKVLGVNNGAWGVVENAAHMAANITNTNIEIMNLDAMVNVAEVGA